MSGKNGFARSATITAMLLVRPVTSPRAARLTLYPSRSICAKIRAFVSASTRSGRVRARETVEADTPAAVATSEIVTAIEASSPCTVVVRW